MLVLARRLKESILIGTDVKVTIIGVHGKKVRIGIDAPKEIAVHRQEIYELIRDQAEGNHTSKAKVSEG